MPSANRVDSIINYQHTRAEDDDLYVGGFVEQRHEITPQRIDEIYSIVKTKPELDRRIFSLENNTLGIITRAQIEPGDNQALEKAAKFTYSLREEMQQKHPDVHIAISGLVMRGY